MTSNNSDHTFLWGVSTSAYQVEGGVTNNDWNYFAGSREIKNRIYSLTRPSIFYKGRKQILLQPAGEAVKFWDPEYYLKDFNVARKMGINSFRISLEWSRIEPQKDEWNQEAIDHYKEMIRTMRKNGLTPIVTLNHFTLPLWVLTPPIKFKKNIVQYLLPSPLKDVPLEDPPSTDPYWKSLRGWENYKTVEEFVKFVERIVQELKDQVDYWITLNEPVASVVGVGYITGLWPPGFFLDGKRAKVVLHNLIEAHVQAYNRITAIDNIDADEDGFPSKVGFAHLMMDVTPSRSAKILGINMKDNIKAARNFSYFINDYFMNAVTNGEEDLNYLNTLQIHNKESKNFIIHQEWKDKLDFIGVDYYRRVHVYHSNILALSSARFVGGAFTDDITASNNKNQTNSLVNDLGWEIYPAGLHNLLMHIKNKWNKSVLITENGIADKNDRNRAPFIVGHLQEVKRAIQGGADIFGYLHWSLMDNYEWQEGYRPEARFGLFQIDRHKNNRSQQVFNRSITRGAEAFRIIIEESCSQNHRGIISDSAILNAIEKFGIISSDGSNITTPIKS
jgi:beta-glucosidase